MSALDMSLSELSASRAKPKGGGGKGGKGGKTKGGAGKVQGKGTARAARASAQPYVAKPAVASYKPSGWEGGNKIFGLASAGGGGGVGIRGRGAAAAASIGGILNRLGGKQGSGGTKVLASNLAFDITDSDVKELFGTVGEVLSAAVSYDRTGRSTGSAEVVFAQQSKALEAIKQFNGRTLDGVAMALKLAGKGGAANPFDPFEAPVNPKAALFGSALGKSALGAVAGGKGGKGPAKSFGGKDPSFSIVLPAGKGVKGAAKPAAGKGAKVSAGAGKGVGKGAKVKPAEPVDLDDDLDSYFQKARGKPAPKAKGKEKAAPVDAAALDDDMDSYFKNAGASTTEE